MDRFEFDDDYVRRLREGDRETWNHFDGYFRPLMNAKLAWEIRSRQAREDLIQETFSRVHEKLKLGELRESSKLGAFVYGVCQFVLQEHRRGRDSRLESLPDAYDKPAEEDPYTDYRREEDKQRVRQMLRSLKDRDRAIFLDLMKDLDKDEICRKHGITAPYLRVLIHRAIQRLRELFGPKNDPPGSPVTFLFLLPLWV